ncbi:MULTISPECIES: response regulator [Methylobacterium]|uniref:Response regulator n=1 Tax=Methylobacterium marchantiae TaxID=600331 RepID=A0ABW3WSX7_9HYPH|nr:response regulator transcription factor [Methylobacterium sp. Leaf86]KQO45711.1 LuxR family transcriptional regulator [Methylobacterium sp. Leaf86]GJE15620.1 Response regulator UvrY [Methylobacterium marchantiae]
MSEIGILLVDDHPVVREGYRRLLERQPGYRVVAEAETASDAYRAYKAMKPTLVIMDLSLPGPSGLEGVRHIRQWDSRARILVFTMHQGAAYALKAFEAGASGYVTKSSAPEELVRSVAIVARGGQAVSADIAQELAAERLSGKRSPLDELGPREVEVLQLVASGMATEAIAKALNLSPKTIQNYHYGIKAKLGARNDAHLVWLAIAAGLIRPSGLPDNA